MSHWLRSFDAKSPKRLEDTWEVGIREFQFRRLQGAGHEKELARLILVGQVLREPVSLFEGWSRPDKDECYVYAGKPPRDYIRIPDHSKGEIDVPARPNEIFLVFILTDGTIDYWNWRPLAPGSLVIPEDVKGKLIWQRSQPTSK